MRRKESFLELMWQVNAGNKGKNRKNRIRFGKL
jgi:hypothetical protein